MICQTVNIIQWQIWRRPPGSHHRNPNSSVVDCCQLLIVGFLYGVSTGLLGQCILLTKTRGTADHVSRAE